MGHLFKLYLYIENIAFEDMHTWCSREVYVLYINTCKYMFFACRLVIGNLWAGLSVGLHPANVKRRYKVTPSLIGWAQTYN